MSRAFAIDVSEITKLKKLLEQTPERAPRAMARVLNDIGDVAKNVAIDETAKLMGVMQKTVSANITIFPAIPQSPRFEIVAGGKSIRLKEFGNPQQTSSGVAVTIMGRSKIYRHVFIVSKLNEHIFKRTEPAPGYRPRGGIRRHGLPIAVLSGPAVQQVLLNKQVTDAVKAVVEQRLPALLEREIGYMLFKR